MLLTELEPQVGSASGTHHGDWQALASLTQWQVSETTSDWQDIGIVLAAQRSFNLSRSLLNDDKFGNVNDSDSE